MFPKIFKKALVLMLVAVFVSGCSFIDDKKSEIEELARQKRQELEEMAKRKQEEIKQSIQDEIDNKIDGMAEELKQNINIFGSEVPSGEIDVSGEVEGSGEAEDRDGIELGEVVEE